ncbi:bifunctional 3-(3-hydroxy-phenyl)propionate/3-hydroxycinnamic acid hydroxylase [Amycolatopsis panacis]|uniref:Bifunctional 3-(3-hydroxy-phenyl)propionate/3-hydroxycinnamic acid hydroxylase n=1 Tax=Amycolatopsis panacis TaxID=2340917 RepID=A0A419HJH2_9PSEU|nr:bifunctional 3-(3-hydroxy-phenyl)propionate/3-hydroxycinnamic acid hydroxylase [Amycolatopsis panacis]RJQ75919.1 bifunctional 3-(3-hydroxy-phenyl)propionate/3-hydroxycinnamic acid hydroxylase [Amycolatopsis panacis]
MSDSSRHFDVAVVGCGTTGLTLAHLLASAGVRVAVIDRWRLPVSFPRATHLDDETMRIFQTLGLTHMESRYIGVGTYRFLDPDGRAVMEFDMHRGKTEQGWNSDYMFHQPDWESVMRGFIQESDSASAYYGWQVLAIEDADDVARLLLRDASSGVETGISASYVVGCDGANSVVRSVLGSEHVDYAATHRSLIVDIEPFVTSPGLPPNLDTFIQAGLRNPVTFLYLSRGMLRFEWLLRPEDDTREFERLDRIYGLLEPWFRPSEYRIARADMYRWQAVVADRWRSHRLFIAGDAAHEMPPHLGQGMCSGVRDATNLAWKLPLVVRGEAPPELLDTYESERKPHMTVFVETAAKMANQIEDMVEVPAHLEPPPVEERGPLRPLMGPGVFAAGGRWAGTLSEQPRLADGTLLDDVVGFRFALVGTDSVLGDVRDTAGPSLRRFGIQVVSASSDEFAAWLSRLGVGAVLIRPDRYVFGTANSPAEVRALISRLEALIQEPQAALFADVDSAT